MRIKLVFFIIFFCITSANSAVELDGVDDFIDNGSVGIVGFPDPAVGVSLWFKPQTSEEAVLWSAVHVNGSDFDSNYEIFTQGDNSIRCTVEGDNVDSSNNFILNEWNHVAAYFSNSEITIWLNTVKTSGSEGRGVEALTNTTWGAKRYAEGSGGYQSFFDGEIDDGRMYNRPFTDQEIEILYKSRARVPITDLLVVWLKMDEGEYGLSASSSTFINSGSTGSENNGEGRSNPVWRGSILRR